MDDSIWDKDVAQSDLIKKFLKKRKNENHKFKMENPNCNTDLMEPDKRKQITKAVSDVLGGRMFVLLVPQCEEGSEYAIGTHTLAGNIRDTRTVHNILTGASQGFHCNGAKQSEF